MSILRILYRHAWKGCVCLSNVGISALPASVRDHVETCRILKIPSNPKYTQAMPQHCSAWLISPMALIATYLYSVASKCIWMISFTKVQYPLKKYIILSKCSNTSNAAFRLKTRYFFERLGYLVLMQYGGDKACNPSRKCSIPAEESCMYFRISGRKPAGKPAAAFFKHLQYLHNKVGKLNLVCRKFQWTLRAWIAQNPLSPEDLRQIYIYIYRYIHTYIYMHVFLLDSLWLFFVPIFDHPMAPIHTEAITSPHAKLLALHNLRKIAGCIGVAMCQSSTKLK